MFADSILSGSVNPDRLRRDSPVQCTSAVSSDSYAIQRGIEPTGGGGGARKPLGSLAPRDAGAPKIQYANPALT
jgi:hypothetical protein